MYMFCNVYVHLCLCFGMFMFIVFMLCHVYDLMCCVLLSLCLLCLSFVVLMFWYAYVLSCLCYVMFMFVVFMFYYGSFW